MQPKVSVIVPIFKAEAYLHRCLDSILAQTLTDFELLLIDDGSPDRSGEICDEYARKDSRIRVFHKQNGGVASARQLGMDEAKGEYVIHADPDDFVEPTMLECLYKCAIENNADVVICDFYVNSQGEEYIVKQEPSSTEPLTVLEELFQQLHGSCCNKLLKRACYNKYSITFHQELTYCEDLTFWTQLYQHPVKTTYLPKAFYHYVQYSKSLCKTHMSFTVDRDWKLIKVLSKDLQNYPEIRRNAISRFSVFIVEDAFEFGKFTTWSFTKRYCKYIPYLLSYKNRPFLYRLFLARVCLGMYGYYTRIIRKKQY